MCQFANDALHTDGIKTQRGATSNSCQMGGKLFKPIPNTTPATLLLQMIAFNQVTKVLFQRIAADTSELNGVTNSDPTVFTREFDNLQR